MCVYEQYTWSTETLQLQPDAGIETNFIPASPSQTLLASI